MYYYKLINDIEQFIENELKDSLYYVELSKKAQTEFSKEILLEFSSDERAHSENFSKAYYYLTGKIYIPKTTEIPSIEDFEKGLLTRILAETNEYKKYSEHYLEAPNKYFKDLFFLIRTSEAQHAMRIPILFKEE